MPPEVRAYYAAQPPANRKALLALRRAILAVVPAARERISYRIPTFSDASGDLVNIAGFRAHCSLFGGYEAADIARRHPGVTVVGSTVRFPPDRPLPAALVRRIVRARQARNAARVKARKAPKRR
jgi:uncharacterized protein YdhG (YjbR/CyaY superfamily)